MGAQSIDLPPEVWASIKKAVGYGNPSQDWTDVERAVAAARPFLVADELERIGSATFATAKTFLDAGMAVRADDYLTMAGILANRAEQLLDGA